MKKLIVCPAGEWAKKLLTISRYNEVSYFIDENIESHILSWSEDKHVRPIDYLRGQDKANIVIIISDSKKYDHYASLLTGMGFEENKHFFNGWKLHMNFYREYVYSQNWQEFEEVSDGIMKTERWNQRACEMAKLIPSDVKSVMDLGCGSGFLRNYLDSSVKYYGVDYCKRDEETIVCDLNKEGIPHMKVDAYYMAGLLPYIEDIPNLLGQLSNAKYIILSHCGYERYIRLDAKIDSAPSTSFISTADLVNLMSNKGFCLKEMNWRPLVNDDTYFLFQKMK